MRLTMKLLFAILIIVVMAPSPLTAAVTPILDSPDQYDEPNLIGVNPFPDNPNPSVLETLYGEHNLRRVNDSVDQRWTSAFGAEVTAVARFSSQAFEPGAFVDTTSNASFVPLFLIGGNHYGVSGSEPLPSGLHGIEFALGVRVTGTNNSRLLSSISAYNTNARDRMVTFEIIGNDGHPENVIGDYLVGWEDAGDWDFQDAVFQLSNVQPVPEPSAGRVALGMAIMGFAAICSLQKRRWLNI